MMAGHDPKQAGSVTDGTLSFFVRGTFIRDGVEISGKIRTQSCLTSENKGHININITILKINS